MWCDYSEQQNYFFFFFYPRPMGSYVGLVLIYIWQFKCSFMQFIQQEVLFPATLWTFVTTTEESEAWD